ncbi:MAG: hypothetical protein J6N76_10835 [Lachnospiraceae bacterium]|nr:hypothetical protein [Lachnospiraceae bacterium]
MDDMTNLTEEEMDEELMDEEAMERDRFTATPDKSQVVLTPQCVSCIHNQGLQNCDVFGEKPGLYISNLKKCPNLEE